MDEKQTQNAETKNEGAIYEARVLGAPKMTLLGGQPMFAMF